MTYYDIPWHAHTRTHRLVIPAAGASCGASPNTPAQALRVLCRPLEGSSADSKVAGHAILILRQSHAVPQGAFSNLVPLPSVLWAGRNKFPSLMVMQYYKISSNHSCRPLVSRLFCPLFRVEKCVYIYIYIHVCVHTIHVIINKYDQIGFIFRRPWCGATVPLVKANSVTAASLSWVTSSYRL